MWIPLTRSEKLSCLASVVFGTWLSVWAIRWDQRVETPIKAERPAMAAPAPQKAAPRPAPPAESPKPPDAPPYVRGGGVLQLAIGPSAKGLWDCKIGILNVLNVYKGTAWKPHLTTVKWFGDRWTLVLDMVSPESAEKMCPWLNHLGWNTSDSERCRRMCTFRPDWFATKP